MITFTNYFLQIKKKWQFGWAVILIIEIARAKKNKLVKHAGQIH